MNKVIVFDTTHNALWAEEVARERGIAVEVVPAPTGVDAKCGMALEVLTEKFDELRELLAAEGVPFRLYG
ncbi:MAG: DUF3343 domain-containing protein [Gemmatimonadota bacterium]